MKCWCPLKKTAIASGGFLRPEVCEEDAGRDALKALRRESVNM